MRRVSDAGVFRYTQEQPGHVSGLVGAGNVVVNAYTYTPWGEPLSTQEQVPQPLRYAAREYDAETGLYFVRARYYDPQQGRFVSEDPIGLEGGMNPYAYAGNDPVDLVDPSGLRPDCGPGQVEVEVLHDTDGDGKKDTVTRECRKAGGGRVFWQLPGIANMLDGHTTRWGSLLADLSRGRGWEAGAVSVFGRDPECERDPYGACQLYVPREQWAAIGRRIRSIRATTAECRGAKNILLGLYNAGPEAGGIRFWAGRDYQYNYNNRGERTGFRRTRRGRIMTTFGDAAGYPSPGYLAYDEKAFWSDRLLPAHEGIHAWFRQTRDPRAADSENEVQKVDQNCPAVAR